MQLVAISKPAPTAEDHFRYALNFYARNGQADSAIARMTAGLLALSAQVDRIEATLAR